MGRGQWCSGCFPQPVGEVDLIRCLSGKSLMGALLVKEATSVHGMLAKLDDLVGVQLKLLCQFCHRLVAL